MTNPDHFDGQNARKHAAVEQLQRIADDAGSTLGAQLALGWAVEHPAVTSALIGPRTEEQLDDLLAVADVTLSNDVLDAIDGVVEPVRPQRRRPRPEPTRACPTTARRRLVSRPTPQSTTGGTR